MIGKLFRERLINPSSVKKRRTVNSIPIKNIQGIPFSFSDYLASYNNHCSSGNVERLIILEVLYDLIAGFHYEEEHCRKLWRSRSSTKTPDANYLSMIRLTVFPLGALHSYLVKSNDNSSTFLKMCSQKYGSFINGKISLFSTRRIFQKLQEKRSLLSRERLL